VTVVGNCSRCGAPIYAPTVWYGITPPPSQPTCNCFYANLIYTPTTTTSPTWTDKDIKAQ
jgi:hypothetical protein